MSAYNVTEFKFDSSLEDYFEIATLHFNYSCLLA